MLIFPLSLRWSTAQLRSQVVDEIFERANVIVTTMQVAGQCNENIQERMAEHCSHLFIDEAHHIAARTWQAFKSKFDSRIVVQFTATPFRTDGKKVDGEIHLCLSARESSG